MVSLYAGYRQTTMMGLLKYVCVYLNGNIGLYCYTADVGWPPQLATVYRHLTTPVWFLMALLLALMNEDSSARLSGLM